MSVLVLFLIPFLMTSIIGMVFAPSSEGNQLPKINVLLADNDKNIASKFLIGAFDSKELKEMFQVTIVDEKEGRRLIGKGKASALVIIPGKFSENTLAGLQSRFLVIKNPGQQFLPTIVEEFMVTFGVLISGAVQVFGPELKIAKSLFEMDLESIPAAGMTAILTTAKDKILSLKQYISPLLLQLKNQTTNDGKKKKQPVINIFGFILPGMAVMFLLFIIEIFMREILTEREDGKLQRIMFSPISTVELILARIFSGWFMGMMVALLMFVFGSLIFNISWGNYLYLFLVTTVTSFWIAGFFALLNSFFKNKNQAGALTSPIILAFSAFGGSMMPIDQLPAGVRWIADLTLNQWFIKGVLQAKENIFPALPIVIVLSTGLIMFFLSTHFLKKRITI